MKKFLIAGSSLAAVAAAGSAGAVDVTLGGSIAMEMEFGVGKGAAASNGLAFDPGSASVGVTLSLNAAGTTDGGLKYGGGFNIATAGELEFDPLNTTAGGAKQFARFEATDQDVNVRGIGYMTSGGNQVTEDAIVSVRINSEWVNGIDGVDSFSLNGAAAGAQNICKVAGWAFDGEAGVYLTRAANGGGVAQTEDIVVGGENTGRLAANATTANLTLTPATAAGGNIIITANNAAANHIDVVAAGDAALDADLFNVRVAAGADGVVGDASVFMGDDMSVVLASSETKEIIGAVCITADSGSNTKMYLDATTNVMSVSGAEVFIEGGFGKLVIKAADYSGEVAAVAGAGDQATVSNSGLTASLSSASFAGASIYGGMSLGTINGSSMPNFLIGSSATVMGATVAFEIENVAGGGLVDSWDLGVSTSLGGEVELKAALDSAQDWGIGMNTNLVGMSLGLTASYTDGAHAKSGLSVDGTLSTTLNDIGLSVGFDESMNYSIGLSYAMGLDGLALTAGYSSEDEGGKVGAKLSF